MCKIPKGVPEMKEKKITTKKVLTIPIAIMMFSVLFLSAIPTTENASADGGGGPYAGPRSFWTN